MSYSLKNVDSFICLIVFASGFVASNYGFTVIFGQNNTAQNARFNFF